MVALSNIRLIFSRMLLRLPVWHPAWTFAGQNAADNPFPEKRMFNLLKHEVMKKTFVLLTAMMLMTGGLVMAQQPEGQEPPKQEQPAPEEQSAPEEQPAPEQKPEESPETSTADQTPAEPDSQQSVEE